MALTPEAAKALLDSLFAMPDKSKAKTKVSPKATSPKAPALKPQAARTTLGLTSAGYLPALRIITVVHQHCTTCGGDGVHALPAMIRFENKKGSAIEIPAAIAERVPVTVRDTFEDTAVCPQCICMSRNIEDFICMSPAPTQLELFI